MAFLRKSYSTAGVHDVETLKAQIADKITCAVMTIDRDFNVTYVNEPTRELLTSNADGFKKIWPTFDPTAIIGTCIDTFHKNPAHQRKLLADTSKLPMKTEITIGDLKIQLMVNGLFDAKGNHVGHVLEWNDVTRIRMNDATLAFIDKAQAVIEFSIDGKVVTANQNFLTTMGYSLDEIVGKHHSTFVEPEFKASQAYEDFWAKLRRGEADTNQYKRVGKGGKVVWLQALYNPILDANGKPFKVVKYATDITPQVLEAEALKAAVRETQGVVDAAKDNDLTKRISLDGKNGEIATLCGGINGLLDTMQTVIGEIKAQGVALQAAVGDIQDVISSAKENDLTQRVSLDGKNGEISTLCDGVNGLLDTMMGVLGEIKASAREVTNASGEITTSTTDLSQRTEEQAASLEETSASMVELAGTVKKNAENAQQANQSAVATRDVADRGGQVVAKAVEAMAKIEESSRKISDIIGVIDEIARQTNLLALNAAVEAARAGEAGRGFAVVASEVRSLAQRSSQAAKDIKDLITNSNGQVKDGVDLVNRAGAALSEIVESIRKVGDLVSDIASASAEQATGIDQVNKALTQLDEVTQQNSALVEENAATAKTLEEQAKAMNDRVSLFRIDDGNVDTSRATLAPKMPVTPAKPQATRPKAPMPKKMAMNGGPAPAKAAKSDPDWAEF